jgi:hypothetical protein
MSLMSGTNLSAAVRVGTTRLMAGVDKPIADALCKDALGALKISQQSLIKQQFFPRLVNSRRSTENLTSSRHLEPIKMPHTTNLRSLVTLFFISIILTVSSLPVIAQTTAARPDRGMKPNGSYSVSDIESINRCRPSPAANYPGP